MQNYDDLRQKLNDYEALLKELNDSKPERVDAETVRRLYSKVSAVEFVVENASTEKP